MFRKTTKKESFYDEMPPIPEAPLLDDEDNYADYPAEGDDHAAEEEQGAEGVDENRLRNTPHEWEIINKSQDIGTTYRMRVHYGWLHLIVYADGTKSAPVFVPYRKIFKPYQQRQQPYNNNNNQQRQQPYNPQRRYNNGNNRY